MTDQVRGLLALIAAVPPDGYLPPMDQGEAEILERIDAGERVFRPGSGGDVARRLFESLVSQLRELRDRGLVDMPERSVAYAVEEAAGAFLMAGPCYVTEAGRRALSEFRRGGLRTGDRRTAERRAGGDPSLPLTDAERRGRDRRQGDRRR